MKNIQIFYKIILIILLLTACKSTVGNSNVQLSVPSLRDQYPKLLEEARKWQSDAHLSYVTVRITFDTHPQNVKFWIDSYFNSLSKDLEGMNLSMSQDGVLTKKIIEYDVPIPRYSIPITKDDWQLDSPEALDIYLQEKNVYHFINSIENVCGHMTLERLSFLEGHPVVWTLKMNECLNYDNMLGLFLDASTGEILEPAK